MNDKLIDRLRKLINHERSAREIGNLAEAEAFASRIQAMLSEHSLSLSDIDMKAEVSSIRGGKVEINIRDSWRRAFLNSLCRLNGVHLVYTQPFAFMSGTETDKAIVTELYSYFGELGIAMCEIAIKDYKKNNLGTHPGKAYRNSYLSGFTLAIARRLRQQQNETLAKAAASQSSTALVFIGNKLAEGKKAALEHFGKFKKSRTTGPSDFGGFSRGQRDGNTVALTTKTVKARTAGQLN